MPHYKDGSEAKVGDTVIGPTVETQRDVQGVLVSITPSTDACNGTMAFAKVFKPFGEHGGSVPIVMLSTVYVTLKDLVLVVRSPLALFLLLFAGVLVASAEEQAPVPNLVPAPKLACDCTPCTCVRGTCACDLCPCPADRCRQLSYAEGQGEALRRGRPLVVWVGRAAQAVESAVSCRADHLRGVTGPCVLLCPLVDGRLVCLGEPRPATISPMEIRRQLDADRRERMAYRPAAAPVHFTPAWVSAPRPAPVSFAPVATYRPQSAGSSC